MGRMIGRIFNIISTVLVVLLALVLLGILGVRIAGLDSYRMISDTMEPQFPAGSVLLVKNTDTTELEKGDVITFYLDGKVEATHRIHEVVEEEGSRLFRTKADALEQPDPNPVKPEDVIGVPVFTVPYLGTVLTYMQTSRGMYLSIGIGLVIILLIVLPPLLLERDGRRR